MSNTAGVDNFSIIDVSEDLEKFHRLPAAIRKFIMYDACISFNCVQIDEVMNDLFGPMLDRHLTLRVLKEESRRLHIEAYGCRPEDFNAEKGLDRHGRP